MAEQDDHVTDEMVKAACRAVHDQPCYCPSGGDGVWSEKVPMLRRAIAAALAAAPTADGWVWCEYFSSPQNAAPGSHGDMRRMFEPDACPGPHRTLLLGPHIRDTDTH